MLDWSLVVRVAEYEAWERDGTEKLLWRDGTKKLLCQDEKPCLLGWDVRDGKRLQA